jgi:molecular chaperone DnaK (HSP70)
LISLKTFLKLAIDDISGIFLTGGSTRIPAIREMPSLWFKKPIRFNDDIVDKAASLGAAILARDFD